MNLTTHGVLAFVLGITFFHNAELALIMTIGAMIPDLDREYLFVAEGFLARHQLHRSLFHNIFVIGALYFLNPFLALGAFSHSLLDSFTSATDRGVELFFPLTRLVRCYYYDINGDQSGDLKYVQWWVEDPWTLLKKTTDRDLQEPTHQPWRRFYGPFKNSRVVDWGIFVASISFLFILGFVYSSFYSFEGFRKSAIVTFIGIGIFYALGEVYRRWLVNRKSKKTDRTVLLVLIGGLAVFLSGGVYSGIFQLPTLNIPGLDLIAYAVFSILIGFVVSYLLLRAWKSRDIAV
jgi:hypothetical protein